MRKRKIISASLILGAFLVLASCSNETGTKSSNQNSTPTTTSTTTLPKTTTNVFSTTANADSEYDVKVTLKYPNGSKFTGAKVKFYDEDYNYTSEYGSSGGVVNAKLSGNKKYYVEVTNLEKDFYSFNPLEAVIDSSNKNVEINLVDLNEPQGSGTTSNPYTLASGYYAVENNNESIYTIKFTKSGKYNLSSFAVSSNPVLKIYDKDFKDAIEVTKSSNNFDYVFDVSTSDVASEKYFYFSIQADEGTLFSLKQTEVGKSLGSKIGDICPSRTLETIDRSGNKGTFTLSENIGKITIVNFWATWCTYCVQEMPDFVKIQNEYSNVDVVAIHQGSSYDYSGTLSFINDSSRNQYKFTWAVGDSNDQYYKALGGGEGIPVSVLVGTDGVIFARYDQMTTYENLKEAIDTYLGK